ncbi:MAG: hypothetical protein QOH21_1456 [Acidobacteriota bacterium]|nr:hypothetical protein [Acidobacteriota bacterium]
MRIAAGLLLQILLAPLVFASTPRITFERTIPAPHDLGAAESIALLSALADSPKIATFLSVFIEETNDSGALRMHDARSRGFVILTDQADKATAEKLRRAEPADIYLGVRSFTCTAEERSGDVGRYDPDRKRVKRAQSWVDARCTARIDVIDAKHVRRMASFVVKGEGTSPRVTEIGDDERDIALEQAARLAGREAAERITPRRVRETITLDETAPAFEEGLAMIAGSRFAEARAVWERALRNDPRSAALRYNLAAVCEALGDRAAAEQNYTAARELAPTEARYTREWRAFLHRTGVPRP